VHSRVVDCYTEFLKSLPGIIQKNEGVWNLCG